MTEKQVKQGLGIVLCILIIFVSLSLLLVHLMNQEASGLKSLTIKFHEGWEPQITPKQGQYDVVIIDDDSFCIGDNSYKDKIWRINSPNCSQETADPLGGDEKVQVVKLSYQDKVRFQIYQGASRDYFALAAEEKWNEHVLIVNATEQGTFDFKNYPSAGHTWLTVLFTLTVNIVLIIIILANSGFNPLGYFNII